MAKKKEVYGFLLVIELHALGERAILFCQTMEEAKQELRKYTAATFVTSVRDEDIHQTLAEYNERVLIFECSNRVELEAFARSDFEAA